MTYNVFSGTLNPTHLTDGIYAGVCRVECGCGNYMHAGRGVGEGSHFVWHGTLVVGSEA